MQSIMSKREQEEYILQNRFGSLNLNENLDKYEENKEHEESKEAEKESDNMEWLGNRNASSLIDSFEAE